MPTDEYAMVKAGSDNHKALVALGWVQTDVWTDDRKPVGEAGEGQWVHLEPPAKCEQCRHPWHDGLCTCGGWGEDEERRAREWHEAHPDGLER